MKLHFKKISNNCYTFVASNGKVMRNFTFSQRLNLKNNGADIIFESLQERPIRELPITNFNNISTEKYPSFATPEKCVAELANIINSCNSSSEPPEPPESPEIEDGTEQYPFLIKTASDFIAFRNSISGGETFAGLWHKLVNDIDLTGATFDPISKTESYNGNFEGNFKKINNFTAINTASGLFQKTTGIIRNLGLENIDISITDDMFFYSVPNMRAGGISANGWGIIERCYVTGRITESVGVELVGGISPDGGDNKIDCWTNVEMNCTNISICFGIGGGIVERCYALGDITGFNMSGGIGSYSNNTGIKNCVAAMSKVSGIRINGHQMGGGINNYALNTMLVNGSMVPDSDPISSPASSFGKNTPISNLKSEAFYRNTMGWDMDMVWMIDEGNDFPKLKGFHIIQVIVGGGRI
jgi:hypothetical protein